MESSKDNNPQALADYFLWIKRNPIKSVIATIFIIGLIGQKNDPKYQGKEACNAAFVNKFGGSYEVHIDFKSDGYNKAIIQSNGDITAILQGYVGILPEHRQTQDYLAGQQRKYGIYNPREFIGWNLWKCEIKRQNYEVTDVRMINKDEADAIATRANAR